MIKAIFFDVGGVLVEDNSAGIFTRHARLLGIDRDRLITVMRPDRRLLSKGLISHREYLRRLSARFGIPPIRVADIRSVMPRRYRRVHSMWAIARLLRRRGYRIGVITNVPPPLPFRPELRLHPLFSVVVRSFAVGSVKPEKRIFDIARRRAGVKFLEMLFFDDKPRNVTAAKYLGIKAFVYKNPRQLVRQLRRYGVRI